MSKVQRLFAAICVAAMAALTLFAEGEPEMRFYPDFIGELVDGRLFALEYKGELTGQTGDTTEKTAIGKLWAGQDPSTYVYATILGSDPNGLTVAQQIENAFK